MAFGSSAVCNCMTCKVDCYSACNVNNFCDSNIFCKNYIVASLKNCLKISAVWNCYRFCCTNSWFFGFASASRNEVKSTFNNLIFFCLCVACSSDFSLSYENVTANTTVWAFCPTGSCTCRSYRFICYRSMFLAKVSSAYFTVVCFIGCMRCEWERNCGSAYFIIFTNRTVNYAFIASCN